MSPRKAGLVLFARHPTADAGGSIISPFGLGQTLATSAGPYGTNKNSSALPKAGAEPQGEAHESKVR